MVQDVRSGHAAPIVHEELFRPRLLRRLKELAPSVEYIIEELGEFRPSVVRVFDGKDEAWAWAVPCYTDNRWLLTVEEFLLYQIARYTGKYERVILSAEEETEEVNLDDE